MKGLSTGLRFWLVVLVVRSGDPIPDCLRFRGTLGHSARGESLCLLLSLPKTGKFRDEGSHICFSEKFCYE